MPILQRALRSKLTPFLSGERETFATVLLAGLMKAYGLEVLDWDGATIQLQVKEDFGVEIPRRVYDQIMALQNVLTTDAVYKQVPIFDETISALNRNGVGVEQGVPSVDDTAWAVAEIRLNDPDPATRSPDQPWGRDIQKYVRVVLDDEGFTRAPKILDFAADRLPGKEGMDDVTMYAATWGVHQSKADEIDQWVESQAEKLISDLMELGIEFETKPSPEGAALG